MDNTTAAEQFAAAKKAAEDAKSALAARLEAIKAEKKAAIAAWKAETKEIRALIGRPRTEKAKTPRKAKAPKLAEAAG